MQGLNGQGNTTFSKKQLDHTAFDEKYNIIDYNESDKAEYNQEVNSNTN